MVDSLRRACNFIKKRLEHKCFPVKFAKFLRTPILRKICKRLLLYFSGIFESWRIEIIEMWLIFFLCVIVTTLKYVQMCLLVWFTFFILRRGLLVIEKGCLMFLSRFLHVISKEEFVSSHSWIFSSCSLISFELWSKSRLYRDIAAMHSV